MNPILTSLIESFIVTGDIEKDVRSFLEIHKYPQIAEHSIKVGYEAKRLARKFELDEDAAAISGFLHDISVVFPNNERLKVAKELGIDVLIEEESFPLIIHQKISKVIAKEIFGICDNIILNAIGCHTTLKANSSPLDRLIFVADKIQWDQNGTPPYVEELRDQLKISLEHGAFFYISYLWKRRNTLKVLHPWLVDAYHDLNNRINCL